MYIYKIYILYWYIKYVFIYIQQNDFKMSIILLISFIRVLFYIFISFFYQF